MSKSSTVFTDIARLALNAQEDKWSERGLLEAVMAYAWAQLSYRQPESDLRAILDEFSEDRARLTPTP